MEFLKSRTTVFLIIMILSVAYIGGVETNNQKDYNNEYNISENA